MRGVSVLTTQMPGSVWKGIEVECGKFLLVDHPEIGFLENEGEYVEVSETYVSREDMVKCLKNTWFNDIVAEYTPLVKESFAWSTLICHWPNTKKILEMCIEENMKNVETVYKPKPIQGIRKRKTLKKK